MTQHAACPTVQQWRLFALNQINDWRAAALRLHLNDCRQCQRALDSVRTALRAETTIRAADAPAEEAPDDGALFPAPDLTRPAADLDLTTLEESELDLSIFAATDNKHALGRLGRYDVLAVLGRGGMGVVLRAIDTELRREVAIKVLNRALSASAVARRRFIREARAAAAINHPNVLTIHSVEDQAGIPFLVMERVHGRTLREEIEQHSRLDPIRTIRMALQIAQGLESAHRQGVIHRDIKPSNVMLQDNVDRIKIMDFGLARAAIDNVELTSRELAVGTPAYMAPEQVNGNAVDARSDLFSLGCVMYALLVGHSPFQGRNALEMARKVESLTPPPVHTVNSAVPVFLSETIDRLLEKDPDKRYQSAADLINDLLQHLAMLNQAPSDELARLLTAPQPSSSGPKIASPARKRAAVWARGMLTGAGTMALLLMFSSFHNPSRNWDAVVSGASAANGPTPALTGAIRSPTAPSAGQSGSATPSSKGAAQVIAREWTVAQHGEADFKSITAALAAATPGSTIRILDDATYEENVRIGGPQHYGLRLIGNGQTTLRAPAASDNGESHTLLISSVKNVRVEQIYCQATAAGHCLLLNGHLSDITLSHVQCQHLAANGVHAAVQVAPQSPDSAAGIHFEHCQIGSNSTAPCVWLHAAMQPVRFVESQFEGQETLIAVWETYGFLEIRQCVFRKSVSAINVVIQKWPVANALHIVNNTFVQNCYWLGCNSAPASAQCTAEIANNLILGCERCDIPSDVLNSLLQQWSFENNWWEQGPQTQADATAGDVLATLHPAGSSGLSLDPTSVRYLVPAASSPLAHAGRSGKPPGYVGAIAPQP